MTIANDGKLTESGKADVKKAFKIIGDAIYSVRGEDIYWVEKLLINEIRKLYFGQGCLKNPIDDRNTYCIQALFDRKNKREQIEKCLTEVTSMMETIKKNNELLQAVILKKLNDIQ